MRRAPRSSALFAWLLMLASCSGSGSRSLRAPVDSGAQSDDDGDPSVEPSEEMDADVPFDAGDGADADTGPAPIEGPGDAIEGEAASDQSGTSIALSADGLRVVIGAKLNDGRASNAGHARVFARSGTGWAQLGADLDGDAEDDRFGSAVAISADGERVAVGATFGDGGGTSSGLVRVFELADGAWQQLGGDVVGPPSGTAGAALALSADGSRFVVGGPGSNSLAGEVQVYELASGSWQQLGTTLTDTAEFGSAVDISDDGSVIAVSLPSTLGGARAGSVRVYAWSGSVWQQRGADLEGEALGDNAGASIALSSTGDVLAIGAPRNADGGRDGGGVRAGHVRVFAFDGDAYAQLGADLDGTPGNLFGTAVALSGDGTRLLAGGIGVARAYRLEGPEWVALGGPFPDDARSGEAVALSADGRVVALGGSYFRGVAGSASGVVRFFALP